MKNILNWIIILMLIFITIPNSNAQYQNSWYYDDNYVKNLNVNLTNLVNLNQVTQTELIQLNNNYNYNTKQIDKLIFYTDIFTPTAENIIKGYQLALEAREMTLKAKDSVMSDTIINKVNMDISNMTSIGADTKPAIAKLEEAKRALSRRDYNNVTVFANDAYRLALTSNVGFVSMKNLISSKLNVPKSKYDGHTVETSGLIRNIKTSGASYNFVIDDGNGVISVYYSGGLGDIKEGDSVSVKGIYNSQNINAESVTKGSGLVGGIGSNVKAPGFETILAISIIGALWLRRKL